MLVRSRRKCGDSCLDAGVAEQLEAELRVGQERRPRDVKAGSTGSLHHGDRCGNRPEQVRARSAHGHASGRAEDDARSQNHCRVWNCVNCVSKLKTQDELLQGRTQQRQ